MSKSKVETQIDRLWDAFRSFDYDAYRAVKSTVDLKNPQVAAVIKRIESHPTWGKSRSEHEVWSAMRSKQEAEAYRKELEFDALHGLHHKRTNVFFGRVVLDPEYRMICDRLGIVPVLKKNPAGERRGEYVHYPVKNKGFFDKRSFRTITLSPKKGVKAVIGCKEGMWMPRKKRCREGTKVQKYLYPPGVKPSSIEVKAKVNPIPTAEEWDDFNEYAEKLRKKMEKAGIQVKKTDRIFIENPTREQIQAIADHFNCAVVRIKHARKNPITYGLAGDTGNMILREQEQKTLEELLGIQSEPEKPKETPDKKIRIGSFGEEINRLKKEQTKHSKDLPDTFRIEQVIMRKKPAATINSPEDVVRLMKHMEDNDREHAEIIHLDTKNQVVGIENISKGSLNASIVHPREAVKGAVLNNSAHVIFVHNHPSGSPEPSKEDLDVTKRLKDAFGLLNIELLDSMIIGKDGHVSLNERKVI